LTLLGFLLEIQGRGVDAITQAGRRRPVVGDVAEMGAAATATDLRADHSVTAIGFGIDVALGDRLVEARPTGAGIELGLRIEQLLPAADARVNALAVVVPVLAGKDRLGAFAAGNLELLGGQLSSPLIFRLDDLALSGLGGHGGVLL
jgi:hypothetical protein